MNKVQRVLLNPKRGKTKNTRTQAQRRAATDTAAFIQVIQYNDQFLFHLENEFG